MSPDCNNCKIDQECRESKEYARCAWYMDNVFLDGAPISMCPFFEPIKVDMTRKERVYQDALNTICAIGFDHDGCVDKESLEGLVDELVEIARDALNGKSPIYIKKDKAYNCFDEEVGMVDWKTHDIIYYNQERNDINGN